MARHIRQHGRFPTDAVYIRVTDTGIFKLNEQVSSLGNWHWMRGADLDMRRRRSPRRRKNCGDLSLRNRHGSQEVSLNWKLVDEIVVQEVSNGIEWIGTRLVVEPGRRGLWIGLTRQGSRELFREQQAHCIPNEGNYLSTPFPTLSKVSNCHATKEIQDMEAQTTCIT